MGCYWWWLWPLSAVRAALEWLKHDEQILESRCLRVRRWVGLPAVSLPWSAGEVRDFFSGNPNLNIALSTSTQHNVVASGGVILRF
jgi:hypothetical protein